MQKWHCFLVLIPMLILGYGSAFGADVSVSDATQECLDCHSIYHPGIVADWQNSRHAATTVQTAMAETGTQRRVSSTEIPEPLKDTSVGCAECHTLRGAAHADTFAHNGYDIHVVVSPDDCATCHAVERGQYAKNIMALAEKNLSENHLYADLQRTILGTGEVRPDGVHFSPANAMTRADACYYCHGTRLTVTGTEVRDTDAGELEFPVIANWPNQGVGRVNLDGSRGACSACHTRHRFSIETARKPYTCKECHVGPDVPAFKVYSASKHGNLFSSMNRHWNFEAVPWTIGTDIQAPTCATCHISLTVTPDGETINARTHQMSDRLGWRIFGLVYAHPQPRSPDTTVIRNRAGLSLPTDPDGTFAMDFLIADEEMAKRRATMQRTCLALPRHLLGRGVLSAPGQHHHRVQPLGSGGHTTDAGNLEKRVCHRTRCRRQSFRRVYRTPLERHLAALRQQHPIRCRHGRWWRLWCIRRRPLPPDPGADGHAGLEADSRASQEKTIKMAAPASLTAGTLGADRYCERLQSASKAGSRGATATGRSMRPCLRAKSAKACHRSASQTCPLA